MSSAGAWWWGQVGRGGGAVTITSIDVNVFSTAGGESLTITGTGFTNQTPKFGTTACTGVTVVNSTTITCTTPGIAAGTYNLVVGVATRANAILALPTVGLDLRYSGQFGTITDASTDFFNSGNPYTTRVQGPSPDVQFGWVNFAAPTYAAPTLIDATFADNTLDGLVDTYGALGDSLNIVADPTGSGRNKVLSYHYYKPVGRDNLNVGYWSPSGIPLGGTIFFRGELYFPTDITVNPDPGDPIARKLLYFQRSLTGSPPDFSTIVGAWAIPGNVRTLRDDFQDIWVSSGGQTFNGNTGSATATGLGTVLPLGGWHCFEVQITLNSSFAASDGIIRIWIDGALCCERLGETWSDPTWVNPEADQKFKYFNVGDQTNTSLTTWSEYRYWANIAFSASRIGPVAA